MLAPAGNFSPPSRILSAHARFTQTGSGALVEQIAMLEEQIAKSFGVKHAFVFGSGREALLAYCMILREELGASLLALPSFTCPDVAAAAVRAGFKLAIVDIDEKTLEPDFSSIETLEESPVVILTNLFGLVDDLPDDATKYRAIIDDACQAPLSKGPEGVVGARSSVGVLSFGRGKPFCGLGGGALLLPEEGEIKYKRFREQRERIWGGSPGSGSVTAWAKAVGGWLLERPSLYWIPASVPWLNLGASSFEVDFPVGPLSLVELSAASVKLEEAAELRAHFVSLTKRWQDVLKPLGLVEPLAERVSGSGVVHVLSRYPIIFPDHTWRERAFVELHQAGLGVSRSYNCALEDYAGVSEHVVAAKSAQGRSVAQRLLTLPMHRYVTEKHLQQSFEILRQTKEEH